MTRPTSTAATGRLLPPADPPLFEVFLLYQKGGTPRLKATLSKAQGRSIDDFTLK
jgi:hypothetical protein